MRLDPVALLALFNFIVSNVGSEKVSHYCGADLSDALYSSCKEQGFPTHFDHFRAKRGVVEECCFKPCSKNQLRQYCNSKLKKAPLPSSKRKRTLHSPNSIKRSKRKRSSWQCDNRPSPKRRRSHKRRQHRKPRKSSKQLTTTTATPWSPEVQYVDDWADSGEAPFFLGSNPLLDDSIHSIHSTKIH